MFAVAPPIKTLARSSGIIELKPADLLLLHIIDDVNCVCAAWDPAFVRKLHITCEVIFERNGLPVKRSKSLSLAAVESFSIAFIGCVWDFHSLCVRPRPQKLIELLR